MERKKPLDDALAALEEKRKTVLQELDSILEKGKGDVSGATTRAATMNAESAALGVRMREMKNELDKLNAEYQPVIARQDEVADELAAETINLKASLGTIEDLNRQAASWFEQMISCIVFGWIMIITGFLLWWFRIQRYEDKILRKRAAE